MVGFVRVWFCEEEGRLEDMCLLMDLLGTKMECGCIKVARGLVRPDVLLERGCAEVARTDCMNIASEQQHETSSILDCTIKREAKIRAKLDARPG